MKIKSSYIAHLHLRRVRLHMAHFFLHFMTFSHLFYKHAPLHQERLRESQRKKNAILRAQIDDIDNALFQIKHRKKGFFSHIDPIEPK